MNREQKRKASKKIHHNIFTKKYASDEKREFAVMNTITNAVGTNEYHARRKKIADINRAVKVKKILEKTKIK